MLYVSSRLQAVSDFVLVVCIRSRSHIVSGKWDLFSVVLYSFFNFFELAYDLIYSTYSANS